MPASLIDPSRYEILVKIINNSKYCDIEDTNPFKGNCLGELEKSFSIKPSTLSHHISLLEQDGLITKTKKGKWTYLFPNSAVISKTLETLGFTLSTNQESFVREIKLEKVIRESQFHELLEFLLLHGYKIVHMIENKCYFETTLNKKIVIENLSDKLKITSEESDISKYFNLIQKFLKLK